MFPILNIGSLAIPVPQFSILISFWIGISLAEKFAPRRGISGDVLYQLVITAVISGIVGARIGYIIQHANAFIVSPISIISFNPGLLDVFSGYSIALLSTLIFARRENLPLWNIFDALTPLIAWMFIGLAFSHFADGTAYGSVTTLPWGINLWGAYRHPTQVYELIAALSIFLVIWGASKYLPIPGTLFLSLVAMIAASTLFLDAFRGDSVITWDGLRTAQIIAWFILAGMFLILENRFSHFKVT